MSTNGTQVSGWVREENAVPFVVAVAELVEYAFDELDAAALDFAAVRDGQMRSYELPGSMGTATIVLSHEVGTSVIEVVVALPDEFVRATEIAVSIMQTYLLQGEPQWLSAGSFRRPTR